MGLLGQHQGRDQIQGDNFLSEGRAGRRSLYRWSATRVINQNIEPAEFLGHRCDQTLRRCTVAHICADELCRAALNSNGVGRLPPTTGNHIRAGSQKMFTDRSTNVPRAPCDQNGLTGKILHTALFYQ